MNTHRQIMFVFVLIATLVYGCAAAPEQPASTAPPPTPVSAVAPATSINAVMVALVDHAAHELWNAEKEGGGPKTDADWAEIEHHATQLTAAGPLIVLGGTGQADAGWIQKPDWARYAQALTDAGVAAGKAAAARNQEQLVQANGQLVESCESCHKEFKPDLPSEGIVHPH